jgi:hypothetical protein
MKTQCLESRRKEHPTYSKGKGDLLKHGIEGKVERTRRRGS